MYQLEWRDTYRGRPSEWQAHVFSMLAGMANMSGGLITWDKTIPMKM
jgi:hypothetical protein